MRGMSDLPLVHVPHPVGTIRLDRLREIAENPSRRSSARLIEPSSSGNEVRSHARG